jgi:SpoVK/Ycf46/Vps4 family AAA+-type ATPase
MAEIKQEAPNCFKVVGNMFFPFSNDNIVQKLPPGIYEIEQPFGSPPYLEQLNIKTDNVVQMKGSVTEQVLAEVEKFWSDGVSQKFKDYGLIHKRGILLHGDPGCGKTITLSQVAKYVATNGGIVLFNPGVNALVYMVKRIREINGDGTKICVMWEEFDTMLNRDEAALLSLLDGELQISNVLYIATTNYISKVPARIKNRPSRFARIIEVQRPTKEARLAFFKQKLVGDDKKYIENFAEITEGFVVDQMKDLIISVCCFGTNPAEAVNKILEMSGQSMGEDDYSELKKKEVFNREMESINKEKRETIKTIKNISNQGEQSSLKEMLADIVDDMENQVIAFKQEGHNDEDL